MVNQQTVGRGAGTPPGAPHLSAEDLAVLRENLREQRLFRREQLRRLTGPVASRAEDRRGQRASAQLEVSVKLAASARMVLADVEAALARMDAGVYGACGRCRHALERERLMIVPQARYCARCQRAGGTAR
ncbi:TraR/DksA family transcriptional regulator [Streptomyces sp. NPDC058947]|uniref:TraR/DksA family transcriptional regulator n=1 Tax=Streptomyces sp. NPDC058947 TaxID=3346675 RepID=UPI003678AA9B